MKIKKLIEEFISDTHWGQYVVSKFIWIFSILTYLKVYDFPAWTYKIFPVVAIVLICIIGRVFDKSGLREGFLKKYYGGSNVFDKTDNKNTE